MPARGAAGFCERCADGEVGEALGCIGEDPSSHFEGYSETVETEKKILRDVFKARDVWMRTGDLMRRDAYGFYTFIDRIGDTFRWKGENVATSEVAAVLRACPGVAEAIVYGVAVPGADHYLLLERGCPLWTGPPRKQVTRVYSHPDGHCGPKRRTLSLTRDNYF